MPNPTKIAFASCNPMEPGLPEYLISLSREQGWWPYVFSSGQAVPGMPVSSGPMSSYSLVVLFVDTDITKVQHLLALAIANDKRVLCLQPRGVPLSEGVQMLMADQRARSKMLLKYYDPARTREVVKRAVELLAVSNIGTELPSLKFTLRIPRRTDRYLEWVARHRKISKADFVRQIIDDRTRADQEYLELVKAQLEEEEL